MSDLSRNDGKLDASQEQDKQTRSQVKHQKSTSGTSGKSGVEPAVFRFDSEKKEIVRVDDKNVQREGVNTVSIASYATNVAEYKEIYKDMTLWDEIVKKREEEIAKGWFSKEDRGSNAFLEHARENFLKFKKMERNHIMSGIIDERNIWEDSDEEEEGDEDSVECLGSGDEAMNEKEDKSGDDEELRSVEHDPFSEDSEDQMGERNYKRRKHDEENEDKSISDDDTVVMGEKTRKMMIRRNHLHWVTVNRRIMWVGLK